MQGMAPRPCARQAHARHVARHAAPIARVRRHSYRRTTLEEPNTHAVCRGGNHIIHEHAHAHALKSFIVNFFTCCYIPALLTCFLINIDGTDTDMACACSCASAYARRTFHAQTCRKVSIERTARCMPQGSSPLCHSHKQECCHQEKMTRTPALPGVQRDPSVRVNTNENQVKRRLVRL